MNTKTQGNDSSEITNYIDGSIVNLMVSIKSLLQNDTDVGFVNYKPLKILSSRQFKGKKKVLLIVIDGLGSELYKCLKDESKIENWFIGDIKSVFPPTTASAITSFHTGTAPVQHGFIGWHMFLREVGSVATTLPFQTRFGAMSLDKKGIAVEQILQSRPIETLGIKMALLQPKGLENSAFSKTMVRKGVRLGYKNLDNFSDICINFITNTSEYEYMFAYIPNIDYVAHQHGPHSEAVKQTYKEIIPHIHKILQQSDEYKISTFVTADHGFIENPPSKRIYLNDHVDLKKMMSLPLCGETRTAFAYIRNSSNDEFHDYIRNNLNNAISIIKSEDLLQSGLLGIGKPSEETVHRVGDYILIAKDNYTIHDNLFTETTPLMLGVHGGHSQQEINVPLFLAGEN